MNDPRTLSDNEHYRTTNVIRQRTLSDNENYPTSKIIRQRTLADKENYLTKNTWRTLSKKEHYLAKKVIQQQGRQQCQSQQRASSPWSPRRSSSRRPRAGFPSESCRRASASGCPGRKQGQYGLANMVNLGSGSEKVLFERLSLFPGQIAAEIPQWQVLNNLKWSQLSKQLSSSQTFPQLKPFVQTARSYEGWWLLVFSQGGQKGGARPTRDKCGKQARRKHFSSASDFNRPPSP